MGFLHFVRRSKMVEDISVTHFYGKSPHCFRQSNLFNLRKESVTDVVRAQVFCLSFTLCVVECCIFTA